MKEDVDHAKDLSLLLQKYGEDICLDQMRVYRLLTEIYPERTPQTVALHSAVREGVAADLQHYGAQQLSAMVTERLARRIHDQTGISLELSDWAVRCWTQALGKIAEQRVRRLKIGQLERSQKKHLPIKQLESDAVLLEGHRAAITGIAFSPNGRWISTVGIDRTLRIWDSRTASQRAVLYGGHRDWMRAVAYAPSGARLATVGDDGGARIWDLQQGKKLHRLMGHHGWSRALAYSHDSALLVTGGRDGRVILWDPEAVQQLEQLGPFAGEISSVCFDAQGRWLAVASAHRVELWDVQQKQRIAQLRASGKRVLVLPRHEGGLIVGDRQGVQIFGVNNEAERRFHEHFGGVQAMALDPCGDTLAVAGRDKKIRLWDLLSGSQIWSLEAQSEVTDLSLNRAAMLAASHVNGKGLLWQFGRSL